MTHVKSNKIHQQKGYHKTSEVYFAKEAQNLIDMRPWRYPTSNYIQTASAVQQSRCKRATYARIHDEKKRNGERWARVGPRSRHCPYNVGLRVNF